MSTQKCHCVCGCLKKVIPEPVRKGCNKVWGWITLPFVFIGHWLAWPFVKLFHLLPQRVQAKCEKFYCSLGMRIVRKIVRGIGWTVLGIILFFLFGGLGLVIEFAVPPCAEHFAHVKLSIDSASIHPLVGYFRINGIVVSNPEPFRNEDQPHDAKGYPLARVDRLEVLLRPLSLIAGPIKIRHIIIEGVYFNYINEAYPIQYKGEERSFRVSNIDTLIAATSGKSFQTFAEESFDKEDNPPPEVTSEETKPDEVAEASAEQKPARKVEIGLLRFADHHITIYNDVNLGVGGFSLGHVSTMHVPLDVLPSIELHDLGKQGDKTLLEEIKGSLGSGFDTIKGLFK